MWVRSEESHSKLCMMRPDNAWNYCATLVTYAPNGPVVSKGHARLCVADTCGADPTGSPCWTIHHHISFGEQVKDEELLVSQDESGTIYCHGMKTCKDRSPRYVTASCGGRYPTVRSPFHLGDTYSYEAAYEDGETWRGSIKVVAKESITVPSGCYTAFRVKSNETNSQVLFDCWTWYSPEVAFPIKTIQRMSFASVTLELVSVEA